MNEPSDAADATDVVNTPGGPRPGSRVHPVRPGEAVRRMPNGTNKVVPADSEGEAGGKAEGDSEDKPDDDARHTSERLGKDES